MNIDRSQRATARPFRALPLLILAAGLATPAAAADAGRAAVASRARHVTMDVWEKPLGEVAAQLAQRGAVDILVPAALEDVEVSASLVDVDVRAALQRLLAQRSYMLIERRAEHSVQQGRGLIEIVLFDTGPSGGHAVAATPIFITASDDRSVDELVAVAVATGSGIERTAAVDAIAYRDPDAPGPGSRAESVLVSALGDPDEAVRAQAIATLKDTADTIPFDALAQVAREDASHERRIQALELLVERSENGESHEPLRIALNDPEAAVRERARQLIEDWHLALDGG